MPRSSRRTPGGMLFHVLNRGVNRQTLFETDGDYRAIEGILEEAVERYSMRLLGYCIMPNHWHMVVWPRADGDLPEFMHWFTNTHAHRWCGYRGKMGHGHVYQARYRAFPIEGDRHLVTVLRYVERNPLRALLVRRAEDWPWSSLWRRHFGGEKAKILSAWPLDPPAPWVEWVNLPQSAAEIEAVRRSLKTGRPLGTREWVRRTARELGLSLTERERP